MLPNDCEFWSKTLIEFRKARRMTQSELAILCGVRKARICKIEKQYSKKVYTRTINKLCDAMFGGVESAELRLKN